MLQQHLGDGVYVTIDLTAANAITLTTGHHDPAHADNVIYIDAAMAHSLSELIKLEIERTPRL